MRQSGTIPKTGSNRWRADLFVFLGVFVASSDICRLFAQNLKPVKSKPFPGFSNCSLSSRAKSLLGLFGSDV